MRPVLRPRRPVTAVHDGGRWAPPVVGGSRRRETDDPRRPVPDTVRAVISSWIDSNWLRVVAYGVAAAAYLARRTA